MLLDGKDMGKTPVSFELDRDVFAHPNVTLMKEGLTPEKIASVKFDPVNKRPEGDPSGLADYNGGCRSINEPWLAEASTFLREEILKRGYFTPKAGPIVCMVEQNDSFVIGHDGSNEPAINTTARLNPHTGDGIVSFNFDVELEELPVIIQRALDRGIAGGGLLAQQLCELGGDFPGFAKQPAVSAEVSNVLDELLQRHQVWTDFGLELIPLPIGKGGGSLERIVQALEGDGLVFQVVVQGQRHVLAESVLRRKVGLLRLILV